VWQPVVRRVSGYRFTRDNRRRRRAFENDQLKSFRLFLQKFSRGALPKQVFNTNEHLQ